MPNKKEPELKPVTLTLFDLRGSIPVDGPLDFDDLRQKAKEHMAKKFWESLEDDNIKEPEGENDQPPVAESNQPGFE